MCNSSGGSDKLTVTVAVHVCAADLCQRVPLPLPRLKMCTSLECFCVTGRQISNRVGGWGGVEADASEQNGMEGVGMVVGSEVAAHIVPIWKPRFQLRTAQKKRAEAQKSSLS